MKSARTGAGAVLAVLLALAVLQVAVLLRADARTHDDPAALAAAVAPYADPTRHSKARFFYGPTYLERASWLIGTGQAEEARRELTKARAVYLPDDPRLVEFEQRWGPRLAALE